MNVFHKTLRIRNILLLSEIGGHQSQKLKFSTHQNTPNEKEIEPVQLKFATYEKEGSENPSSAASPLIILHGLCGSKGNWNSLCKAFVQKTEPHRKIIAIDSRNHGDSPHSPVHNYDAMALDAKVFLESQNLEKACLLGHSMGGRAFMLFALKWPELVEKLIICDISPVSMSNNVNYMRKFLGVMKEMDLGKNIRLSAARINADKHLAKFLTSPGIRAFLLTNLVESSVGHFMWRLNLPAILENFAEISKFPAFDGRTYTGPTLFVGGANSDYIRPQDHSKIKDFFPNAEFRMIEGAGHWLHVEKPFEFMQIVLDHINQK